MNHHSLSSSSLKYNGLPSLAKDNGSEIKIMGYSNSGMTIRNKRLPSMIKIQSHVMSRIDLKAEQ